MEKGTEILKNLSENGFSDEAWHIAQKIGQSQSRIMRMSSVFQNELAKIARQRVMLSDGGLSSSELAAWLKEQSVERLADLVELYGVPEPFFALPDVMLDQAEAFIERDIAHKKVSILPPPVDVAQATAEAFEYPPQLAALTEMLSRLETPLPLADVVVGGDFSAASYRYSLLAFLGEHNVDADLAVLAEQPCSLRHDDTDILQDIHRGEISRMTAGKIEPHPA
jgi:hypothetical protein